eukprot:TRINITY_DN4274_c0_g1_i2.p1 TRINITY_DN4274_c0_g1~~TRINITY_DN4274_c0_g1_i2.p1  ORF type:complete len:359 (+),score=98.48 TRINITY_DN4274_c0_g1_i2:168-1244(+)
MEVLTAWWGQLAVQNIGRESFIEAYMSLLLWLLPEHESANLFHTSVWRWQERSGDKACLGQREFGLWALSAAHFWCPVDSPHLAEFLEELHVASQGLLTSCAMPPLVCFMLLTELLQAQEAIQQASDTGISPEDAHGHALKAAHEISRLCGPRGAMLGRSAVQRVAARERTASEHTGFAIWMLAQMGCQHKEWVSWDYLSRCLHLYMRGGCWHDHTALGPSAHTAPSTLLLGHVSRPVWGWQWAACRHLAVLCASLGERWAGTLPTGLCSSVEQPPLSSNYHEFGAALDSTLRAHQAYLNDVSSMLQARQLRQHTIDEEQHRLVYACLLYTSDAADEEDSGDIGGRRVMKKTTEWVER